MNRQSSRQRGKNCLPFEADLRGPEIVVPASSTGHKYRKDQHFFYQLSTVKQLYITK